jgi:hypothetical protein
VDKYKHLYETALEIGERHSHHIIKQANEIGRLRRTIWHALNCLRVGKIHSARVLLEQQIKKDQQP